MKIQHMSSYMTFTAESAHTHPAGRARERGMEGGRGRERERQTDRDRQRERETNGGATDNARTILLSM